MAISAADNSIALMLAEYDAGKGRYGTNINKINSAYDAALKPMDEAVKQANKHANKAQKKTMTSLLATGVSLVAPYLAGSLGASGALMGTVAKFAPLVASQITPLVVGEQQEPLFGAIQGLGGSFNQNALADEAMTTKVKDVFGLSGVDTGKMSPNDIARFALSRESVYGRPDILSNAINQGTGRLLDTASGFDYGNAIKQAKDLTPLKNQLSF